jgi:hypothetical protein
MARNALAFALLFALAPLPAPAMTNDPSSIAAPVARTPGWSIDRRVNRSDKRFDPATGPFLKFKNESRLGGFVMAQYAAMGMLAGGIQVMAIPLDSGGSGTVFTQLI